MRKALPTIVILLGIALLIYAYVDCYRLTLAAISEPGTMYCGFLPFGVIYDLIWEPQYAWVRILCPILVFAGILLRVLLCKRENAEQS